MGGIRFSEKIVLKLERDADPLIPL